MALQHLFMLRKLEFSSGVADMVTKTEAYVAALYRENSHGEKWSREHDQQ
jgi:hypothetical protein